jgi:short chain dehydrogenase
MDMNFRGKIVLVMGGASGIGRACAREFAARHATIALVDRDAKNGEEAVAEIGNADASAAYFNCDVTKAPQVERLVGDVVSRFGGVDVVVNNAGIQPSGTVVTLSVQEWDESHRRQSQERLFGLEVRHTRHACARGWLHRDHKLGSVRCRPVYPAFLTGLTWAETAGCFPAQMCKLFAQANLVRQANTPSKYYYPHCFHSYP